MPKSRSRKKPEPRPRRRRPPDLDASLGAPDDVEDLDVIVATDDEGYRHAAVLPRSVSRLDGHQTAVVKSLQRNAIQQQVLRSQLDYLVDEARDMGISWAAIGWSVGTTGEAARQRWGDFDAASEPR